MEFGAKFHTSEVWKGNLSSESFSILQKMYQVTPKGGFFSESAMKFFQISKSQKKNIPKNYPELEI